MAFQNKDGLMVSYDCSDLINELADDIYEYGPDLRVEVVTQRWNGVTLYKDFNLIMDDPKTQFVLEEGEELTEINAVALLRLYVEENSAL